MKELRSNLVEIALAWERAFGVAPQITTALSELDAAMLVGCSIEQFSASRQGQTAVQKGHDFDFNGHRYQVKGTRPSGKPNSTVTRIPLPAKDGWDFLIWILYNPRYKIQEAWMLTFGAYTAMLPSMKGLYPRHLRQGTRLK